MMKKNFDACPLCGGGKKPGTTTFTADLGFGVVVIRNVPAIFLAFGHDLRHGVKKSPQVPLL